MVAHYFSGWYVRSAGPLHLAAFLMLTSALFCSTLFCFVLLCSALFVLYTKTGTCVMVDIAVEALRLQVWPTSIDVAIEIDRYN